MQAQLYIHYSDTSGESFSHTDCELNLDTLEVEGVSDLIQEGEFQKVVLFVNNREFEFFLENQKLKYPDHFINFFTELNVKQPEELKYFISKTKISDNLKNFS